MDAEKATGLPQVGVNAPNVHIFKTQGAVLPQAGMIQRTTSAKQGTLRRVCLHPAFHALEIVFR